MLKTGLDERRTRDTVGSLTMYSVPSLGSVVGEIEHLSRVQQPLQLVHQPCTLIPAAARVHEHQQRTAAGTRHRLDDKRSAGTAHRDDVVAADAGTAPSRRRTPSLPHRRLCQDL